MAICVAVIIYCNGNNGDDPVTLKSHQNMSVSNNFHTTAQRKAVSSPHDISAETKNCNITAGYNAEFPPDKTKGLNLFTTVSLKRLERCILFTIVSLTRQESQLILLLTILQAGQESKNANHFLLLPENVSTTVVQKDLVSQQSIFVSSKNE